MFYELKFKHVLLILSFFVHISRSSSVTLFSHLLFVLYLSFPFLTFFLFVYRTALPALFPPSFFFPFTLPAFSFLQIFSFHSRHYFPSIFLSLLAFHYNIINLIDHKTLTFSHTHGYMI